eukprot:4853138-Amphidinium_carterae.1
MKAHQSDRDAGEGRVKLSDLYVPFEPSEEWKHWGTVCLALRHFWLLVGPKLRIRPEGQVAGP